jgi:hypothetical protein
MTQVELQAFFQLFKSVCAKCFGHNLEQQLSQPESRHLSNEIEENTGLVVGWKTLKNYSAYVINFDTAKPQTPSAATLDTLARYLVDAPVTTETQRKRSEAHFGYWFQYLEQFGEIGDLPRIPQPRRWFAWIWLILAAVAAVGFFWLMPSQQLIYSTDFQQLEASFLQRNGWFLLSKDSTHWQQRSEKPGCLSLFTLAGDNWHSKLHTPKIPNLLTRAIKGDCFSTEVHFKDFIPKENWQQSGLILLEDTVYAGKSLRLSLAYNDYYGGYDYPGEVIVQTVAGFGKDRTNVEEVHHHSLFSIQTTDSAIVRNNLQFSGLRIEKQGQRFRFLYAASPYENFSFKELGSYDFDIKPHYLGVFALKGFVDTGAIMPVRIRFFRLEETNCID